MASKEQVASFGVVLGDLIQGRVDFRPSVQLCNEFASRILAEAHQAGEIAWKEPDASQA